MRSPAALQRQRKYTGPTVFAYGFRPFFFAAGLWAALGMLLWLPQYLGQLTLPTYLSALDWHMLYGYVAASIAGFLLTAIHVSHIRRPQNPRPRTQSEASILASVTVRAMKTETHVFFLKYNRGIC
jgi:uncharacterized protein involved in response to NO